MNKIGSALLLTAVAFIPALSQNSKNPFLGRWDLTVTDGQMKYASWLEVTEKAGKLEARAQQTEGHAMPVVAIRSEGQRLVLTVAAAAPARPAEGGRGPVPASPETVWDLTEKGGKLSGVSTHGKTTWQLAGVRAPALKRPAPAQWGSPEPLFNGKDLTGWQPINNTAGIARSQAASRWTVKNGELVNEAHGSNLRTTRTFDDFKLHLEYNASSGGSGGIFLRGRYEAQVSAPPAPAKKATPRKAPGSPRPGYFPNQFGFVGCIYGMLGPASPPPFRPEWQVYDITLVGRMATVVFNGVTTVANGEIAGVTGGAMDSNEGEPGPIYLQGDHNGEVRYRNITISLPKR
jgi:hypothetical protein